jgi:EAL domain-containing protein (putative c-di-GMP-specific phosphodiesterase class I)
LSLSSNLQIDTVAEGVETFEQLDLLGAMGCDVIQGYVYSKPVTAEDFANLLSKNITLDDIRNENTNKILKFPA